MIFIALFLEFLLLTLNWQIKICQFYCLFHLDQQKPSSTGQDKPGEKLSHIKL